MDEFEKILNDFKTPDIKGLIDLIENEFKKRYEKLTPQEKEKAKDQYDKCISAIELSKSDVSKGIKIINELLNDKS